MSNSQVEECEAVGPHDGEDFSSDCEDTDDEDDFEPSSFASTSESSDDEPSPQQDDSEAEDPPYKKKKTTDKKPYCWRKEGICPESYPALKIRPPPSTDNDLCRDSASSTPINLFSEYFPDPVMNLMVKASNLNASESSSKLDVTVEELKAFIGLLIIMGFHKLPSIRHYWNADPNFSVPRVSSVMNLKRFCQILRFLCASGDVSESNTRDREFRKMRPLMDHLNERFGQVRQPSQWVSMDAANLNRLYSRREKRFKITAVCCSETGYLYKLVLHKKDSNANKLALDMMSLFHDSECGLALTKRFSNFPLIEELTKKKIFVCAEISQDLPEFPRQLRSDQQINEEFDYVLSDQFSVTKWKNKRKWLWILSVLHDPLKTKNVLKRSSKTTNTLVECPESVLDYNKHRHGVKRFDHARIKYTTSWKSRDRSIKLFYYLLDASIVNSYVLFKDSWQLLNDKERPSPLAFRSALADSLIGEFVGRQRPARAPVLNQLKKTNSNVAVRIGSEIRLTNVGSHLPIASSSRRCALCSTKGRQKRSTISCSHCEVGLCLPCFTPFHTERS